MVGSRWNLVGAKPGRLSLKRLVGVATSCGAGWGCMLVHHWGSQKLTRRWGSVGPPYFERSMLYITTRWVLKLLEQNPGDFHRKGSVGVSTLFGEQLVCNMEDSRR